MRNQFFGDVYDYIKYGLIRRLTNNGETPSALCWMMREDENNNEGRITQFYEDLGVCPFEPPVFDLLMTMRDRDERDVRVIERSGLLPNTRFHSPIITDDANRRHDYFNDFFRKAEGRELVCFDPDTGIQGMTTAKPGKPESSKYLMRDEAKRAFSRGHSLLLFVHNSLVENEEGFMDRASRNLAVIEDATYLFIFRHRNAGFLLVPQNEKIDGYARIVKKVAEDWPQLKVSRGRL